MRTPRGHKNEMNGIKKKDVFEGWMVSSANVWDFDELCLSDAAATVYVC